jgi:hypothetical protein
MASLTNTRIKDTYIALLKTADSGNITNTPEYVSDGLGNSSQFSISSRNIGLGTETLNHISGTNPTLTLAGSSTSGGLILQRSGTDKLYIYEPGNDTIRYQTIGAVGQSFIVNSTTNALTIKSNGNIGIIETDPNANLHIKTTSDTGFTHGLKIERSSDQTAGFLNVQGGNLNILTASSGSSIVLKSNNVTGLTVNDQGNVVVAGTISGTLADGVVATTQSAGDNSTKVATTAYVNASITAEDLDFAGDSGTGSIDLDSQTFTIAGTTNEVETIAANQSLTIGLPSTIHTNLQGNVTGNLTGDVTGNISGATAVFSGTNNQIKLSTGTAGDGFLNIGHFSNGTFIGTYNDDGGAADLIRFGTHSGDERMTITSAGIVQIQSGELELFGGPKVFTSNATMTLQSDEAAQGQIADIRFRLRGSEAMRLENDNGTVALGIGLTDPTTMLEVGGNIGLKSDSAYLRFRNAAAADLGYITNSTTWGDSGSDFSIGASSANLRFYTNNSSTERMRIDSSGNVGIGEDTPNCKLDVKGAVNTTVIAATTLGDGGGAANRGLAIRTDTDGGEVATVGTGTNMYLNTANNLYLQNASNTKVIMLANGNVGIGNSNPSAPLDVAGIVRISESSNTAFYGGNYVRVFSDQNYGFRNSAGTYIANISMSGNSYFNGGNVGIGTTAPVQKLHIVDTNGANIILNSNTGAENNGIWMTEGAAASPYTDGAYLHYDSTNNAFKINTGASSLTTRFTIDRDTGNATFAGDVLVEDNLYLTDGGTVRGKIQLNSSDRDDLDIKVVSLGSNMKFFTVDTERMRIDSSGILLINSTSTAFSDKLYVNGDAYTTGGWRVGTAGTFVGKLINNGGKLTLMSDGSRDVQIGNDGNPSMLYVDTSAANVGIGTTSPREKLDIAAGRIILDQDYQFTWANGTTNRARIYGDSGNNFIVENGSSNTERLRITSSGNVGIGTTSPAVKFEISESGAANLRLTSGVSDGDDVAAVISFSNAAGSGGVQGRIENVATEDNNTVFKFYNDSGTSAKMTLNPNGNMTIAGTLTQNSDASLKENVKEIDNALSKVKQLQGVEFNKIGNNKKEIGVIAQDVEKVLPELVLEEDGVKSVAYGNITAVLIEAIKEQQEQIEQLKKQIQLLNK